MNAIERRLRSAIEKTVGRPYALYELRLAENLYPKWIDFPLGESGLKDLLFVPRGRLREFFLKDDSIFYSEALREYYRYIGAPSGRIDLGCVDDEKSDAYEFEIIRWGSVENFQFPHVVPCVVGKKDLTLPSGVEQVTFAVRKTTGRRQ